MSWSIDDVDLGVFIKYSCILGQNRDSTLSLNIVGVHDALFYFLVGTEHTTLTQQLVYQGSFTVVYMGDNGNVSDIFAFRFHCIPPSEMVFIKPHLISNFTNKFTL